MIKMQDTEDEYWERVPEFEDYYQISNLGRVKTSHLEVKNIDWEKTVFETPFDFSVWRYRDVEPKKDKKGNMVIKFTRGIGHGHKTLRIIDLVAELFVTNPFSVGCVTKPQLINGNKKDCRAVNIYWEEIK